MTNRIFKIKLSDDHTSLIDYKDKKFLKGWTCSLFAGKNTFYVQCYSNKLKKHSYLHKIITGTDQTMQVDHKNGNRLDNRRKNLRVCTSSQNSYNRKHLQATNSSGFKGVSFEKFTGRWKAYIGFNHRHITIGRFDSAEEAAKAYNQKAIKLFGKFASCNKIGESK